MQALEDNTRQYGIEFFNLDSGLQGIVHVIGPELGLTQPGMTIACGDSHTSTHGAFGAIGFGVGTTQIRDILATQTLAMSKPKVRRVQFNHTLGQGVVSKDIILYLISKLSVKGGIGYAYEYAGEAIEALDMEARMSICNMSIEGGARVGYINPDQTTFAYLKGRRYAPQENAFAKAVRFWQSLASQTDAEYDDIVTYDARNIDPMVTWGINPGQAVGVNGTLPKLEDLSEDERQTASPARKSTWPLSVPVPTGASAIFAQPRSLPKAGRLHRTYAPLWFRVPCRWPNRRKPRDWMPSLQRPAFSGAERAVPCAWP